MKKLTLHILALATVISITPSVIYPVEVTKDGITIRISNEQGRSEELKSNDLACFYVRIKNDTGSPIEMPKYAVSSSFTANEKVLREAMSSTPKEIGKFIARFIAGAGIHHCTASVLGQGIYWAAVFARGPIAEFAEEDIVKLSLVTSLVTGSVLAAMSLGHQLKVQTILQEYLDRKATTIQIGGEHGCYVYVNLDQYQRSIGKSITVRLHKKDTNQAMIYEVDTTGLLQTA